MTAQLLGLALLLSSAALAGDPPEILRIRALAEANWTGTAGRSSSRRLTVEITDGQGHPVSGAVVTFTLPREGPGGRFLSGFRSETCISSGEGLASVAGIQWNDTPGEAMVRVRASRAAASPESRGAEAQFAVTLSAASRQTPEKALGGGGFRARKWIIIAGVAGGAFAGLSLAGSGKSSSPAPAAITAPPLGAPTLGQPSITIGRP